MVPANATEADVGFILRHSKVRTVVVSDAAQLRKVTASLESLPDLQHIVSMDPLGETDGNAVPLEQLIQRGARVPTDQLKERSWRVRIDDLATVMYTSGTTGMPKGIQFSQRNLVFKRFARALAIPEIGDTDVFCVSCRCSTPSGDSSRCSAASSGARPTASSKIRRSRRWCGHAPLPAHCLHQRAEEVDAVARDRSHARPTRLTASDDELLAATRGTTGGRLRWGLSAAGYLDPDIFRFFQRQGVELMSGFGMTEATGGITMTPPGGYRDDSLGLPLPGIEVKLADDGEMWSAART